MRHYSGLVTSYKKTIKLAYLKDGNAAAHSVDSDKFQSSDSSICALQDLTLTFILNALSNTGGPSSNSEELFFFIRCLCERSARET